MAGKDLRAPFQIALSDLRDKRVLTVKPTDLVKVTITSPAGQDVVLTGTRTEEPPKPPKPGPDGKVPEPDKDAKPTYKVSWQLTAPAGVRGDKSIESMARNLANVRAAEFVPADKGTERWDWDRRVEDRWDHPRREVCGRSSRGGR